MMMRGVKGASWLFHCKANLLLLFTRTLLFIRTLFRLYVLFILRINSVPSLVVEDNDDAGVIPRPLQVGVVDLGALGVAHVRNAAVVGNLYNKINSSKRSKNLLLSALPCDWPPG